MPVHLPYYVRGVRFDPLQLSIFISDQRVVIDGPIVTSQAAGTAMEFAFALVEILCGADKAAEVNRGVLARL